ncbi:MAG TPA: hypothetical protein PLJ60_07740, partial [Chryseolinea sp.]|nr:hypothetical protein [Chryseolinea sp.]
NTMGAQRHLKLKSADHAGLFLYFRKQLLLFMKSLLSLLPLAFLLFGACEKEKVNPSSELNVFVSGYEYDGNKYIPKYWKNGTPVPLPTTSDGGEALSIFASGNDVYCSGVGMVKNGTINIWKNGHETLLTDGTQSVGASNIVVVGNDVYVAGNEGDVPKYWKNGIPVVLEGEGSVTGIAVDGNDVYVSGTWNTNEIINTLGIQIAVYWKNGIQVALTDNLHSALASSIMIVDHNVYISGSVYDGTVVIPVYWKNGARHDLPSNYDNTTDIFVNGNDVYVLGRGKYWKNDVAVEVTHGADQVELSQIFVSGADVYLSGFIIDGTSVAVFWKNGVVTLLTDGKQNAYTSSIFVQNGSTN